VVGFGRLVLLLFVFRASVLVLPLVVGAVGVVGTMVGAVVGVGSVAVVAVVTSLRLVLRFLIPVVVVVLRFPVLSFRLVPLRFLIPVLRFLLRFLIHSVLLFKYAWHYQLCVMKVLNIFLAELKLAESFIFGVVFGSLGVLVVLLLLAPDDLLGPPDGLLGSPGSLLSPGRLLEK